LRTLRTKQLLDLKNRCYESFVRFGYGRQGDKTFTYEELKQVFSERPHIPNRAETNIIRKKSAKYKKRFYQSSK